VVDHLLAGRVDQHLQGKELGVDPQIFGGGVAALQGVAGVEVASPLSRASLASRRTSRLKLSFGAPL
jgi:hypothetical protein